MNPPKVSAATHNSVSNTKLFTVMVDIPYVLLPELLQFEKLNISYKNKIIKYLLKVLQRKIVQIREQNLVYENLTGFIYFN